MVIQTQHLIRFRHHQMQVVRDHQHRAIQLAPQLVNEIVQGDLTIDIHALSRLIQHQQLWLIQQRAG